MKDEAARADQSLTADAELLRAVADKIANNVFHIFHPRSLPDVRNDVLEILTASALTAAKPSAAPTAEALEEVASIAAGEIADRLPNPGYFRATVVAEASTIILAALKQVAHSAEALEEVATAGAVRLAQQLWSVGYEAEDVRLIANHILAALKQVAHPAGKEKMREALREAADFLALVNDGHAQALAAKCAALSSETPQRDEQQDSGRETRTPQIADGRTSQSDTPYYAS